jgi:limonene-1,2-epoxide hydrolase
MDAVLYMDPDIIQRHCPGPRQPVYRGRAANAARIRWLMPAHVTAFEPEIIEIGESATGAVFTQRITRVRYDGQWETLNLCGIARIDERLITEWTDFGMATIESSNISPTSPSSSLSNLGYV